MLLEAISIIIASITLMLIASDILVKLITKFSKESDFPPYITTIIAISLGSSLPEITNSITFSVNNLPQLSFYNMINSIILDFTLVLGIIFLLKKSSDNIPKELIYSSITAFLALIYVLFDKNVSNLEGIVLFLLYPILMLYIIIKNLNNVRATKFRKVSLLSFFKYSILITLSVVIIVVNSIIIYNLAEILILYYHVQKLYAGFFLGFFTIFPELLVAIVSYLYLKKMDIALYNILGTFITDSTLGIGIPAAINSVQSISSISIILGMMAIYLSLSYLIMNNIAKRNAKTVGTLLIMEYFLYMILLFRF